ncbi:hypothetical protein K438DRAFT_1810235, partial [Mycena galopus ATCC 62051]
SSPSPLAPTEKRQCIYLPKSRNSHSYRSPHSFAMLASQVAQGRRRRRACPWKNLE